MSMQDMVQMGRLAMREEGGFWVAYYAHPKTMELAERLGSIHMGLIVSNPERKQAFMGMMREACGDLVQQVTGKRPEWREMPAPERDRGVRP